MRHTIRRTVREDGREVERVDELVRFVRQPGPWRQFMMISGEGLDELHERLADRSMGMQAVRVLLAMVRCMDRENRCRAGRKDLARMLEMREGNISAAIKTLVDFGFIEKGHLRFDPYVVSPRFAWNSSTPKLREALEKRGMLGNDGMMMPAG